VIRRPWRCRTTVSSKGWLRQSPRYPETTLLMSSVLISRVGVNFLICICAVVCRTMAQQQMNPPRIVYTCTHCRKPFSDRSNCRRHMQTQHSLDGQVRGVSAEQNDNRFELRRCVDVALNELLSGNFTQSAAALVSQVRTLLPTFNDREAQICHVMHGPCSLHLELMTSVHSSPGVNCGIVVLHMEELNKSTKKAN